MENVVLAFVTGLTTGGLSCLAVQGGLLASSVAHEVEQTIATRPAPAPLPQPTPARRGKKGAKAARNKQASNTRAAQVAPPSARPPVRAARPIALFLAAKVVAYTLLGFLLGLLGSVLQLTPTMRAILLIAIGVFMLGNALRMFNVHPIFRYFNLEPPRAITRYIRRKSKDGSSAVTPLFLGALTVLIPCGVTQAMMAVAMATGNPVSGAVIMLAFTLGASPVFFAVAYLATRLGSRLEAGFTRVVAVIVLVLGLVSIDGGLTLAGWPYSVTNLRMSAAMARAGVDSVPSAAAAAQDPAAGAPAAADPAAGDPASAAPAAGNGANTSQSPAAALNAIAPSDDYNSNPKNAQGTALNSLAPAAAENGIVTVAVKNEGYFPTVSRARANEAVKLTLVTNDTYSCAVAFVIQSLGIQRILPSTGTTVIDLPPQKPGTKLFYSCSMGMYSGVILYEG